MRAEDSADVRVLGGRYHLDEVLGVGGMSVVWRARDEVLGRDVAVKVLSGRYATDPLARQRIRVEARAAAGLAHPNVAHVYDFGETGRDRQPTPYIIMELVPGPTLGDRVAAGPISAAEALRICAEVAAGLAAAHARGLVHRDVKPANVILAPTGAKVVDFGIAAAAEPASELTPDGAVLGTPAYLAPERITDNAVTPASDVYALGVLLFKLFTGGLPWAANSPADLIRAHLHVAPDPLPARDGVPAGVARLASRCLAKSPGERPTAHELATGLAAAAGVRVAVPTAPARSAARRIGLVAAGLAVVAAGAVVVWVTAAAPGRPQQADADNIVPSPFAAEARATSMSAPPAPTSRTTAGRVAVVTSPASTGAAPATTGGAVADAVVAAPPPPNSTTAEPAANMTFTSEGGSVRATCTADGLAELMSWAPRESFRLGQVDAGPARKAGAVFTNGDQRFRMIVTCRAGTPEVNITNQTK
ncbi:protein kinase [Dactylosporangium vinaceum]|uniref:Protein kinase n=1 Tax=Dactylosporangium vinaceum TaxID=53362 RepID=A0ABV5MK99_9ACTN|nr:serine/threonine-protein kinase [Dactylosporangium vinaceum]UAB99651.1 protein kinase [Dactylosporangium vinaceum]